MAAQVSRPALLVLTLGVLSADVQGQSLRRGYTLPDGRGPLTLEWSDPASSSGTWFTEPTATIDVEFLRLRLRGGRAHAGTWFQAYGRVSIAEAFFVAHPEPIYDGLRRTDRVPMRSLGFAMNESAPASVYPEPELEAFVVRAWGSNGGDSVQTFAAALLKPTDEELDETLRVWNGKCPYWREDVLDWWRPVCPAIDPTILNMRALTERLIQEQTDGQVGSEFFTSGLAVEAAQLGMVLELQALTVTGSATLPEQYPESEQPPQPPPGLRGYPAPGVSSLVSYQFTGTGGSHVAPHGFEPALPVYLVVGGSQVDFPMNGLFNDTYARVVVNGLAASESLVPLVAGSGFTTARMRIPMSVSPGDVVEVVGFVNPFGQTSLPPGTYFTFHVL